MTCRTAAAAALLLLLFCQCSSFTLTTTSKIKGVSTADLHNFLATPTNWPQIVASSNSVKQNRSNPIDVPLKVGDEVEEVFGLPPLIPLSVVWKCVESLAPDSVPSPSTVTAAGKVDSSVGRLEFYSASGVPNIATDCKMKFLIRQESDSVCSVKMDMEFDPVFPLLLLGAAPILKLDNDLALKVLLPNTIKKTM